MSRMPNIVLVLADQWRGQDQGWAETSRVLTPHLDQLAATGVAVRGACSNAPVCGPSRATLLTGRLPGDHGVVANDLPLRPGTPTLAGVLRDRGYRTGWIGNWHLDGMPREHWVPPVGRAGFEYWASRHCSHEHIDGHYYTGDAESRRVDFTGYEPVIQTDLAIDFILASAQPYFLTVSIGPPHDPYETVPQRFRDRYQADAVDLRGNVADDPVQRETQRLYWAAISAVDEQIGRLVQALRDAEHIDDTLIIVTSDHGDMLGSHGRRAKQVPFAESVSVPLVLSWPSVLPAGLQPDGLFGLVDLAPTVLALVGAVELGEVYGQDRSAALRGEGMLPEDVLIGNWVSHDNGLDQGVPEWRGLRSTTQTYARSADGAPWLLFDDLGDPWQLDNLAGDPVARDRLRAADARLDQLLSSAHDRFLPALALITELGLAAQWDERERVQRGPRARLVGRATGD